MSHLLRRAATLVTAPALALAALAATPGTASAAEPTSTAGASWLAGQLNDQGLFVYDYFGTYIDTGSTIDAGLAFDELGVEPDALAAIVSGIQGRAQVYTRPGDSVPTGTTLISAGATAKTLVLAQATGADVDDFGGVDLDDQLEARVSTVGATEGRVQDSWQDVNEYSDDYANVVSQALAVRALDADDSLQTDPATDFLLAQQCTPGYFREYFAPADAAEQGCVDGSGDASVDATAQAVLGLASQDDDTDVSAPIAAAGAWLAGFQNADGSFDSGEGDFAFTSNANSTGLAARALAVAGQDAAAAKAAAWVRGHQAANAGACATYAAADLGAIAYDDAGLAAAQGTAIDPLDVGEWIRTSVQALPALELAPDATGTLSLDAPSGFVKGGAKLGLTFAGVAPGAPACLTGAGTSQALTGATGPTELQVTAPAKTGTPTYTLTTDAGTATASVKVLGAKTLKIALTKKVTKGTKQKISVRGLAKGERVTIRVAGTKVKTTKAPGSGVVTVRVKATGKPGKRVVKVQGEFATRTGKATFQVVR